MAGERAVFYIGEAEKRYITSVQEQKSLRSPSAALREIIKQAQHHPVDDYEELNVLADVLEQSTQKARESLQQAFAELAETKAQLKRLHNEHH